MKTVVCTIEKTEQCAAEFVKDLSASHKRRAGATVVGLSGELGVGKTAFVQMVAKAFGITDTVTSPTFVIEKVYRLLNQPFDCLIHIDAYRLENINELRVLGWGDIVKDPANIIFIEWSEKVEELLPDDTIKIDFEVVGEEKRKIVIKSF